MQVLRDTFVRLKCFVETSSAGLSAFLYFTPSIGFNLLLRGEPFVTVLDRRVCRAARDEA
jgi:hypothetical protein